MKRPSTLPGLAALALVVLAVPAAPPAQAGTWGPFNAEFPYASDGIVKKPPKGELFADSSGFALGGGFKPAAEPVTTPAATPVASPVAPTLLAGLDGAGFLCSVDGKAAFCADKAVLRSDAALAPGAWTHLAASYDGRQLSLSVNGRVVARQAMTLAAVPDAQLSLGPRGRTAGEYAGRVAGLLVSNEAFEAPALARMAARPPEESLIAFETGSPHWPLQTRQMHGQVTPQDAWTLPVAASAPSAPVAKPAYGGPALESAGVNTWKLRDWRLRAAPEAGADGKRIADPAFEAGSWLQATVPGTVLTTLIDRGVYPDPSIGLNNLAIPETLNKQDYWYRSSFALPAAHKPGRRLFLTFKGINYAAQVWVNGRHVGDMKGAFIRGSFDIGPYVRLQGRNVVAVKVSPPPHPGIAHEESLRAGAGENGGVMAQDGPTFIASEGWDWIPSVRDRNTGIWREVLLRSTGDLRLGDTQVLTTLTREDNSEAEIGIEVPVTNLARHSVRATVRATVTDRAGTLKPVVVARTVLLAPGEQQLRFTPRDFAALRLKHPRLWWPNGYGRPELHQVKVEVLQGARLSDQGSSSFGIRAVTYELSLVDRQGRLRRVEADFNKARRLGVRITDARHEAIRKLGGERWANGLHPSAEGTAAIRELADTALSPHLVLKVNGVRIAARGGNWGMDDWLKRVDRQRLEPYFRLHRDANVNVIRNWVGQNTEEEFFELADEYGLMVFNDFWASTQDYNVEPQDLNLFVANARDTVKRFRNHPSVVAWFGRNEGVPPPALNEALENLIYELDGTRWYTGSSNRVNLAGSGPYNHRPAHEYFTTHAKGFSVEVGVPSVPTLEAIKAAIPQADRWPLSDSWAYHDWHPDGNGGTAPFMAALRTQLGAPDSLEDFERKAQMLNYEAHRAIFEGMNAGLWRENSGRMLWMTQPAWPSTMWQILSHDYDTHAAFYATKRASEPVHVQMNLPDYRVMVINNPVQALENAVLSFEAYAVDGRLLGKGSSTLSVKGVATSAPIDLGIPAILDKHGLAIVKLSLRHGWGGVISENVYWPAREPGQQRGLNALATVPLGVTVSRHKAGAEERLNVTLRNPSRVPVLNAKMTLLLESGARVLPTYYSDNYVSLMPGESKTLTADFAQASGPLKLALRAWNSAEHTVAVPAAAPPACATTAAPRKVEYPWMSVERWQRMHADQAALARQQEVGVMFLGDSITEGWPQDVWQASFGRHKPGNFGIGGDHTGNLLYRLQDPAIAGLRPKAVVLLIGTNNLGLCGETPQQVFEGIKATVAALRARYPGARILLNAVLPAGETAHSARRTDIVALNRLIATLGDGKQVVYRDYGRRFTGPDGSISPAIMPDFLHLSHRGYEIWAEAMREDVDRLVR